MGLTRVAVSLASTACVAFMACSISNDPLLDSTQRRNRPGEVDDGGSSGGGGGGGSGGPGTPEPTFDGGRTAETCLEELVVRGVGFEPTSARGVVDAVRLTDALNGVLFASSTSSTPSQDPMACEFVLTLWDFAEVLKQYDIVRVGTLGAYCYRCCCSWSQSNQCRSLNDPEPNCGSNGYSNHSFGRALDVRWLTTQSGQRYDLNDASTWVKSSGSTCEGALAAQTGVSRTLYEIACETSSRKIFNTVLTANYNSAHRNHWHMDTGQQPSSRYTIRSLAEPEFFGVDEAPFDVCGADTDPER